MAGGMTNYAADAVLAGVAIPTTLYLKFHVGDPGADAILNAAIHTTRKAMTFEAADLPAKSWNDAATTWPGISANENASHFSLWSAVSGGNPWFVGEFDPVAELANGGELLLAAHRVIINSTPYES